MPPSFQQESEGMSSGFKFQVGTGEENAYEDKGKQCLLRENTHTHKGPGEQCLLRENTHTDKGDQGDKGEECLEIGARNVTMWRQVEQCLETWASNVREGRQAKAMSETMERNVWASNVTRRPGRGRQGPAAPASSYLGAPQRCSSVGNRCCCTD